jgi:CRISPR-associated exonuclease Cas4
MDEIINISALNQYAFCPRRCALLNIEGVWADNEHTIQGSILHERADEIGYETVGNARLVRALPLFSLRYGLSGKADVVEIRRKEIVPVEYKKGKRRKFENDEIQLCAQALCLEEMFQTRISRGFIYHAASKKRREVLIDEDLRNLTLETLEKVRQLLADGNVPPAELKPRCEGCSLYNVCLPQLSDSREREKLTISLINDFWQTS